MLCKNCNIDIDNKFKAAIKHNKCPACDGAIMSPVQLMSFAALRQLLISSEFSDSDAEKAANLVITNFEIKQLIEPKSDDKLNETKDLSDNKLEQEDVEVEETSEDEKYDQEYKRNQINDARSKLKEMRAEALNEATAEHWGMMDETSDNVVEEALRMRKQQSAENVLSGNRGAFRRG